MVTFFCGVYMGHIYWEKPEIKIPDGAYVNKSDARVFTMCTDGKKNRKRTVIGRATGNGNMHPNDNFKYKYPALWTEHYGNKDKLPPHSLSFGLYTTFLAISERTGLYNLLHKNFGPLYGNAIMDYTMFSAYERSNSTHLFEDSMNSRMLFSKDRHSDSWFSELFSQNLRIDAIHQLKIDWLKQCAANGCTNVWICIDGSNNDCNAKAGEINEFGLSKSHNDVPIVSYIWAVDADTGRPITWFVNPGSMIDSKAFRGITQFLAASSIVIKGIIADRGFCSNDVINLAEELNIDYVIMLKSSTHGAQYMLEKHCTDVRWQVRNVINDKGIFGITDMAKIFANSSTESCIGLFFDGIGGAQSAIRFICKVLDCFKSVKAAIAAGASSITIPPAMKKYIALEKVNGVIRPTLRYDEWQTDTDIKGFYTIASSRKLSAAEIHNLYSLRDVSEKQFAMMKSQLGSDVTRVHSRESIESKLAVAFIASVIRTEMLISCRDIGLDVNRTIQHLDRCKALLLPDGMYTFVDDLSAMTNSFFKKISISTTMLKYVIEELNKRLSSPMQSQIRRLPQVTEELKRKRGRPRKDKSPYDEQKPKRKPGRPKGSKNKSTLEKERLEAEAIANGIVPSKETIVKRKPGRPKGSKNKSTIEREAKEKALHEQALKEQINIKRGRGRPKGSKNKSTLEREKRVQLMHDQASLEPTYFKRGRGRPKGSKNKKTLEREAKEQALLAHNDNL